MSLPVINAPTYELVVPSTKEKIVYRPFLVKEEKILLMAMEEEQDAQLNRALKQVVHNCTFDKINVDKLPLFDLEYIFLRIRAHGSPKLSCLYAIRQDHLRSGPKRGPYVRRRSGDRDREHRPQPLPSGAKRARASPRIG